MTGRRRLGVSRAGGDGVARDAVRAWTVSAGFGLAWATVWKLGKNVKNMSTSLMRNNEMQMPSRQGEIRNSKAEIRRKSEARIPKRFGIAVRELSWAIPQATRHGDGAPKLRDFLTKFSSVEFINHGITRKLSPILILLLISGAGALSWRAQSAPPQDGSRFRTQAIYGEDDRIDVYQEQSPQRRQWAAAVCALIVASSLSTNPASGEITLTTAPFRFGKYAPCADEAFRTQPLGQSLETEPGLCTGFLISSNLVATAGHCVESECDLAAFRFVFGFQMLDAERVKTNFTADAVYHGVEVVRQRLRDEFDYAVIRLDRAVVNVQPLAIRSAGNLASDTPVGLIGYPVGLPLKLAFGSSTRVGGTDHPLYFTLNSDSYGGNSGSPVINPLSGEVEGIFVRGVEDFFLRSDRCLSSKKYLDSWSLEQATRITAIPWSSIFDIARPANDAFADRVRLTGIDLTAAGSNIRATREGREPLNTPTAGGKSVWWSWTASSNAMVTISTAGSDFDTTVGVYSGTDFDNLKLLSSSGNGGLRGASFLIFRAVEGESYHISVDGACGATGDILLTIRQSAGAGDTFGGTGLIMLSSRKASPYPSEIEVGGLSGVVSRVRVTLEGLTHAEPQVLVAVLQGPQGQATMLMAHIGGATRVQDLVLTFDDAAPTSLNTVGVPFVSGTYQPSPSGAEILETAPAPGPGGPYGSKLTVFGGSNPNGVWRLYMYNRDTTSRPGQSLQNWTLNLETVPNTSPTISPVQDQVFSTVNDVSQFSVAIGDPETPADALTVTGRSSNPALIPDAGILIGGEGGTRRVYLAPVGGGPGTAEITLTVQDGVGATNTTTFRVAFLGGGSSHYASTGLITMPSWGEASPYPSEILVSGLTGKVSRLRVTLEGLAHQEPQSLYALLESPQRQAILLMAGVGGPGRVENSILTFDDAAPTGVNFRSLVSGTYRPSSVGFSVNGFPGPAPAPPYGSELSMLNGSDPNGVWHLYLWNQGSSGSNQRLRRWNLNLETEPEPVPRLEIKLVPGQALLSWNRPDALLQSAPTILGKWEDIVTFGTNYSATIQTGQRFFRLVSE